MSSSNEEVSKSKSNKQPARMVKNSCGKRQWKKKEDAMGGGAEVPADAVEEIDADKEDEFVDATDTDPEGRREVESREESYGSTCHTTSAPSRRAETSKKRSRSSNGLTELVEQIGKFRTAFQETKNEIKAIASYFKKEAERIDRRMALFTEIMQLEGFSKDEMPIAGDYTSKNTHKVDFFFALPKEFRRDYIVKKLSECNPH